MFVMDVDQLLRLLPSRFHLCISCVHIMCAYHVHNNILISTTLTSSQRFPNFDFSEIVHNEDVFYSNERETDEHCCDRAVKFLEWLNKRPEKCIAVVTHSSFLRHLFGQFGENLHKDDMDNMQRLAGNCELRSIVLCSHGNKDGKNIDPLMPPSTAPSTGKCYMHILKSLFFKLTSLLLTQQHLPSYTHLIHNSPNEDYDQWRSSVYFRGARR